MDRRLAAFLLLTLWALAVRTESHQVAGEKEESDNKDEEGHEETEPSEPTEEHKTITLNLTICIPNKGNKNARFIKSVLVTPSTHSVILSASVDRTCTDPSCKEEPELVVLVHNGKELICTGNVTSEDAYITIDTDDSKIGVSHNKTAGLQNMASAYINVITSHIFSTSYSNNKTEVTAIVEVQQTWDTTSGTDSTTTKKPANATTTKKPATTTKAPKPTPQASKQHGTNKASRLGHGALWGIVLLVLFQVFLN
ncbi:uncharacterized protein [Hyperolius riggenbachi]|uniref:uncharacterized protein n=1 Tax=Hyperolius riggenbachi TaxID=752182 RepID=UPI0035A3B618